MGASDVLFIIGFGLCLAGVWLLPDVIAAIRKAPLSLPGTCLEEFPFRLWEACTKCPIHACTSCPPGCTKRLTRP
jgi:hypothetical protein